MAQSDLSSQITATVLVARRPVPGPPATEVLASALDLLPAAGGRERTRVSFAFLKGGEPVLIEREVVSVP